MNKSAWAVVSALLCAALVQSQTVANQPGNPLDVTARDLESSETQNNWLTYHGDYSGHRYSDLKQITRDNITQLQLKWVFHSRKARVLGATPVVVGGVMYLTASNDLFAIDGRTGAVLWHHTRQDAAGAKQDESAHINRGVAVWKSSLFMETDDAHLLSLDARSGNVIWDVPLANGTTGYGGVSVPIVVQDKVIAGTSGGLIEAFDAASGKESWKFEIQPASSKGDPSYSLTEPNAHQGANPMPGTYDPGLGVIYWTIADRPCGSAEGAQPGKLRHDGCLLALDPGTGELKWRAPLSNHGVPGPAVASVPVLVDSTFQGTSHKLIIVFNGKSLDIFDRDTGKLLVERNVDSIQSMPSTAESKNSGAVAREVVHEEIKNASMDGNLITGWNPPSYNNGTHTFYFISQGECCIKATQAGNKNSASGAKVEPRSTGNSALVAYDPVENNFVWKSDTAAINHPPAGSMTTASGLLLFGGRSRSFQAADATTGKALWSFPMGQSATAPPMSYSIEGNQYFAIAAGNDLFVFGLP